MKTIAITGAAGIVGSGLRLQLGLQGYALRLLDVKPITDCAAHEESVVADICDQAQLTTLLAGCDAVVHLAGQPVEAPWPVIRWRTAGRRSSTPDSRS